MQLWFPSSLEEPLSTTSQDSMTAQNLEPELTMSDVALGGVQCFRPCDMEGLCLMQLSEGVCIVPGRGGVEVPWWTYGARGMQLWFSGSPEEPLSPPT